MQPSSDTPARRQWSADTGAALAQLEPIQRDVIVAVYFGRRTQRQVARELSLPLPTVARMLAAGMQALAMSVLAGPGAASS